MSYRYSNGKEVLVNTQTGDYTLTSEDNGAIVVMDKATAVAVTVPANLTVGFNCVIIQKGAGTVTVTPSGTTVNSQGGVLTTAAQYDGLWLRSTAADVFNLKVTPASGGGMTVGSAVTSGGANRVLYEDGSQNLAASANMTYGASASQLKLIAGAAADVPLKVQLAASPTGDPLKVVKSDGTTEVFKVTKGGYLVQGDAANTAQQLILRDLNSNNFGAIYSGGVVVGDASYAFACSGSETRLNAPSAQLLTLNVGNTPVVSVTDSRVVSTMFVQTPGGKRVTSNVTNATATMSSLSDLSVTLVAGRKYSGTYTFFAKNSTAAEGLAFDFNGGSATFTSIEFGFAATPPGSGLALGTLTSTAAATAVTATTATTADAVYTIAFTCVVNAGGTLIPRFAEVSHTSGTATVEAGSFMRITDVG